MKKILFVCTGNTCRGPMAEILAKSIFKQKNINIEVISRGIAVYFPSNINADTKSALEQLGFECHNHKARQISEEDIQSSDLVLTMTSQHKAFLEKKIKDEQLKRKIYTIAEYTKADCGEINDPFEKNMQEHIKCIKQLSKCIEILADLVI